MFEGEVADLVDHLAQAEAVPIPFHHREFRLVQPARLAAAEHAADRIDVRVAAGEQAFHEGLRRGLQVQRGAPVAGHVLGEQIHVTVVAGQFQPGHDGAAVAVADDYLVTAKLPGDGTADTLAVFLIPLLVLGCSTPDVRQPLDETRITRCVVEARASRTSGQPLSLGEAVERMRKNNPRIQRARAAYRTAGMVAATRTPRANPSIDVAPLLVGQPDILSGVRMGVDLFLGWSVPLTGRLRMQDDLNAVTANAALVDAAKTEREEYLLLRGEMLNTAIFTALHAPDQTVAALGPITILSLVFSVVTVWRRSIVPAIVAVPLRREPAIHRR